MTQIPKFVPNNGIKVLFPGHYNLGEGCIWHPEFNKFFWIDIYKNILAELDPKTLEKVDYNVVDHMLTNLVPKKGGFVATSHYGGFCEIDYPFGSKDVTVNHWSTKIPTDEVTENVVRYNDGACDPMGRMIGGTMNMSLKAEDSNIYIMDSKTSKPRLFVENIICTNAPNFSQDGKTFYYVDSFNPPPLAADYDIEKGELSNKRPLLEDYDQDFVGGAFDGACIDTKGCIWWAIFGGKKIIKIDPNQKKIVSWIDLSEFEINNPTCVCFGGDDYRTMFVTSECYHPTGPADLRGIGNNGGVVVIKFDESEDVTKIVL